MGGRGELDDAVEPCARPTYRRQRLCAVTAATCASCHIMQTASSLGLGDNSAVASVKCDDITLYQVLGALCARHRDHSAAEQILDKSQFNFYDFSLI